MTMSVRLVGWTHFDPPADVDWSTDADGGQALAEFAGRACYQSWSKPNPATATNAGYLRHILDSNHLSVLEHGTATMYITGVSRALTHELVRHRHFSYSQLSQRYVLAGGTDPVEPAVIAADPHLHRVFTDAVTNTNQAYAELAHCIERALDSDAARHRPADPGQQRCATCGEAWPCRTAQIPTTIRRKAARQAARSVLPNATETRIVVTGNYRAWRHFITLRATEHADPEIRQLAVTCLAELHRVAPNVFADYVLTQLPDGTWTASTPYAT